MFTVFLALFLFILLIFVVISSILIFHLLEYRLPGQSHTKEIIIFFITGSALFLLLDFISFFNVPWDLLNF